MIRMIHGVTGCVFWVDESRIDEYMARGHRLASPPVKPQPTEPVKRPPAKKKTTKKKV